MNRALEFPSVSLDIPKLELQFLGILFKLNNIANESTHWIERTAEVHIVPWI